MKTQTKQSGMRKKKIIGGIALLATALGINYFTHLGGAIYSSIKTGGYPIYPVPQEVQKLMNYQRNCLNECRNPWVFVPGSFMWRSHKFPEIEGPSKYRQLEKSYQEKIDPGMHNLPKVFKI